MKKIWKNCLVEDAFISKDFGKQTFGLIRNNLGVVIMNFVFCVDGNRKGKTSYDMHGALLETSAMAG
jgi:hypothetical protein